MEFQYKYTEKQMKLSKLIHKLWEQHIMWTRSFIISVAEELKDLDLVTNRLLQNPTDMANALSMFYSPKITHEFKKLFTEHLEIAGKLVVATKEGNNKEVMLYRNKWYENADQIAAFLAKINPYWKFREWQKLLHSHLKMTEQEAIYQINGQYEESIRIYDKIEKQALMMADYMFLGLIKQFDNSK